MKTNIRDVSTLSNGVKMPWLGFGVFKIEDGQEVEHAVGSALEAGYRSIDTASAYENEGGVGKAIKHSGIPRGEIFLTTKVANPDQRSGRTLPAFAESLKLLKTDYVDLLLIHWPVEGCFIDTWRVLEGLYDEGKVRAIGVSNFLIHHLQELLSACTIAPMVNQVEFHPFLVQSELLEFHQQHDIQQEAWSPLMKAQALTDAAINKIAQKYRKSPAQIILRWDLQHDVVTIPKSVHSRRMAENTQIFDFELTSQDVEILDGLDAGKRVGPDPNNFNF